MTGLGREAVVSTAGRGVTDTGPVRESPDAGRSVAPALPAESGGLSAGEQPTVGDRAPEVEAMASSGGRSFSAHSATVKPSAPAERPFQPDWKKGKK